MDVLTLELPRTFAVPAFEGLVDALAYGLAKPYPGGEVVGGEPVVLQHDERVAIPRTEEADACLGPLQQRPPGAEVAQHVLDPDQTDGVDEPQVTLECPLIPEPLGLLVRVDMAADPGEQ